MARNKKFEKRNARLLLVTWVLSILFLTLIPGEYLPRTELGKMDKVVHLLEFFALGFLLMNFFLKSDFNIPLATMVIISIAAGSIYGGAGELLQNFVGRNPDIYDFLSDLLGLNLGIFMYLRGVREWHS